MFAKAFTFARVAILVVATVLLTAGPSQAFPPWGYFGFWHYGAPYRVYYRYHYRYYGASPYYYPYYGYSAYYPYYGYAYDPYYNHGSTKPERTAEEKDVEALLTASGVPTEDGQPVWPLSLRILPGAEAQALRGQIDSLLQVAATQASRGQPNPAVVQELAQATDRLRKLLLWHQEERGGMAQTTYTEGKRFLDKLEGAQKLLRVPLTPALATPGSEGKGGSHASDNRP